MHKVLHKPIDMHIGKLTIVHENKYLIMNLLAKLCFSLTLFCEENALNVWSNNLKDVKNININRQIYLFLEDDEPKAEEKKLQRSLHSY
jgi:hypothetical protein